MSNLPKLKVRWQTTRNQEEETICDFEQAKGIAFGSWSWAFIIAEGKMVRSYEELVQLAAQDEHKNKEMLNVMLIDPAIGGG
ncbi:MAG: hypothetical protein CL875_01690 [Dehalococcoidales bacterium]|jgi:hypothetical protein|nr:hypothetical protein [Dehalococcoidales bacterium]|tara:strand:- start:317 stop:562 length:246 start_codon:yes stop_codon:yes gene_type:complete